MDKEQFQKKRNEIVLTMKELKTEYDIKQKEVEQQAKIKAEVSKNVTENHSLRTFPERNELDDDPMLASIGVRMDYYKNYKIYYIVESDVIYIVRIFHMLVDSRTWLYRSLGLSI